MRLTFSHGPLFAMMAPLLLAAVIILSVARPPQELFQALEVKKAKPVATEVELEKPLEELVPPPMPLESLADNLAPESSGSDGLANLTAGVVSGDAAAGSVGVQQGEVRAEALVQESGQESRAPKLTRSRAPIYPSQAQNQGVEGYVLLHVQVLADGKVGEIKVLEAKPVGVFEAAARRAVSGWGFSPGIEKGKPAVMWVKHKVNFALD